MVYPFLLALWAFLIPITLYASEPVDEIAQAKVYLKDHIKKLNHDYLFSDWEEDLAKTQKNFGKLNEKSHQANAGKDKGIYKKWLQFDKDISKLDGSPEKVNQLIHELYAFTVAQRIEEQFRQEGKVFSPLNKIKFQRMLMPLEARSLKPRQDYLLTLNQLKMDCKNGETEWLFNYAEIFLSQHMQALLADAKFAQNEAYYDDDAMQLEYWSNSIATNAEQAASEIEKLQQKFLGQKNDLLQHLETLQEALNADMLFSELLAFAEKDKMEITVAAEEKIEVALKAQSNQQLQPIQTRLEGWKRLEQDLLRRKNYAFTQVSIQKNQALANEQRKQQEEAQMAALHEEQKRLEAERSAKFKATLTSITQFSLKTETTIELDDEAKNSLQQKNGVLKTTVVQSGVNKLTVEKSHFSDTLAFVQRFSVAAGQIDFSKLSLQEKTSQSAYTFASPSGRTNNQDLNDFVNTVALGSYSTYFNFISFTPPLHWLSGRKMNWQVDKDHPAAVQDREFSYVDLVVDAHRTHSVTSKTQQTPQKVNLPPNMLIIFHPQGNVIRFQSFSSPNELTILRNDLIDGKLYYKFLNYSADRRNIYLNGIDPEIKNSTPSEKS